MNRNPSPAAAIALALLMSAGLVSGCASPRLPAGGNGASAGGGSTGSITSGSPAADGEVLGLGTVLQLEGGPPELCLGGVAESYPPQCSGPPVNGWDWDTAGAFAEASGVTWGAYAVQGTWDGSEFTVTGPPTSLALWDPMPFEEPRTDPENPGAGTPDQLAGIQRELAAESDRILTTSIENGYLFVTVIYDDGAIQEEFDARFGPRLVAVQSALTEVG